MAIVHELLVKPEKINQILRDAISKNKFLFKRGKTEKDSMANCCYIHDGPVKITVTTEYQGQTFDFYTYKDGRDIWEGVKEGGECYRVLSRHYWKPQRHFEPDMSASPLIGCNPEYNNTRQTAWGYDLNSAYSAQILKGWIDEWSGPTPKIIEEDEIGFDANLSSLMNVGEFSLFVFKKCPPPEGLVRFINHYYEIKKNPRDAAQKAEAKNMLNHTIGCLQNKNPFLRAYVIASCNDYIRNLLNEDSLLWNTDSIVSRTRRYDIEENLGSEIGQWKLEHEGEFAYIGLTYQWNYETPTWRSVPKKWIPEHYDILDPNNPMIVETNVWTMDWEQLQLIKKEGLNDGSD